MMEFLATQGPDFLVGLGIGLISIGIGIIVIAAGVAAWRNLT